VKRGRVGQREWVLGLGLALLSAACASSTGGVPVPKPFPTPGSNTRRGSPAAPPVDANAPATPQPTASAPAAPLPEEPVAPPVENIGPQLPGTPDYYALVGTALHLRGTPYRDGGADLHGFDCSGFTQYVFAQYGVSLPRAVRDQFKVGTGVRTRGVEPGDLLFFTTTEPGASHVGIAVGSDEFVHAPSSTGVVRVERLSSTYWAQRYIGARRIN
jgi:cell wall-associated NlpC family hydrolase